MTNFEAGLAAGAAVAALTGNFAGLENELDYLVQKTGIDAATGGKVSVDLDALVDFYNTLSDLHLQIEQQISQVKSTAHAFYGLQAGGKVPGAQQAFKAMAAAAGIDGTQTSLVKNLDYLDSMVLQHMVALEHNAQQYAAHEGAVIRGLGQAGSGHGGDRPIPAGDAPPPRTTGTGIGGK